MDTNDLVQQLGRLRRGRGLRAPNIARHVGSAVRQACGVGEADDPIMIRIKVTDCIRSHSETLPDDLRLAALAALGLHDAALHLFLKDRLKWIGRQLDREPRTASRRVDAGLRLLAERLTTEANDATDEENQYAPRGWYTDELRSTVRLDLDPPELREERSIVATRDGLCQTLVSLTAPGAASGCAAPEVRLRVEHGGRLLAEKQPILGHYQATLKLTRPLAVGDRHEYAVTFVLRPRESIQPYYLLTPLRPCYRFFVSVVFDRGAPSAAVWRLDGVPRGLIDNTRTAAKVLAVDEHGQVTAEFHALCQGLSYGVHWSVQP